MPTFVIESPNNVHLFSTFYQTIYRKVLLQTTNQFLWVVMLFFDTIEQQNLKISVLDW